MLVRNFFDFGGKFLDFGGKFYFLEAKFRILEAKKKFLEAKFPILEAKIFFLEANFRILEAKKNFWRQFCLQLFLEARSGGNIQVCRQFHFSVGKNDRFVRKLKILEANYTCLYAIFCRHWTKFLIL